MAQWVNKFANRPDKPSSIPETHVVEGEDQFLQVDL